MSTHYRETRSLVTARRPLRASRFAHTLGTSFLFAGDPLNPKALPQCLITNNTVSSVKNYGSRNRVANLTGWDCTAAAAAINFKTLGWNNAVNQVLHANGGWLLVVGTITGAQATVPPVLCSVRSAAQYDYSFSIKILAENDTVELHWLAAGPTVINRAISFAFSSYYNRPLAVLATHDVDSGYFIVDICILDTGQVTTLTSSTYSATAGYTANSSYEQLIFGPDLTSQGAGSRNTSFHYALVAGGGGTEMFDSSSNTTRANIVRNPFSLIDTRSRAVYKAPAVAPSGKLLLQLQHYGVSF